jgi:hypothetical protein
MNAPTLILMDVDQHAGLPFPRSLRELCLARLAEVLPEGVAAFKRRGPTPRKSNPSRQPANAFLSSLRCPIILTFQKIQGLGDD